MELIVQAVQIIIAASVAFVWIFRFENVEREFKQFGLSTLVRSFVGAAKVALATLLVVALWYPALLTASAAGMGLFMLAAQYFHFKIKNPLTKHLPSFFLLICSVFLVLASLNII